MVEQASPHQIEQQVSWQIPAEFKGIMGYNPGNDIQDFLDLEAKNGSIPPENFAQLQIQTIHRKKRDLEKMLGERFRVEKSTVHYFVENSRLMSADYPLPVIEQYKKGQQYLKENSSTEQEREQAEIDGLEANEKLFVENSLKEDETVIIASPQGPKGTLYIDNFFDLYKKDGNQITMTRFYSTHSYQDFLKAAQKTDSTFKEPNNEDLNSAFFLQKPIVTSLSEEQILETFGLDLNTQTEVVNQEILEACLPYIMHYINQLIEHPRDIKEVKLRFNAIPNVADSTEKQIKTRSQQKVLAKNLQEHFTRGPLPFPNINEAATFFGRQAVRTVDWGCPGGQRGFSVNQSPSLIQTAASIGAQSVVDFAPSSPTTSSSEKILCCTCPFCNTEVEAVISGGKIKCPECKKSAPYKDQ